MVLPTDGISYLRDCALTLCALLAAFPACGQLLLHDQAALLGAFQVVHDELLPLAHAALTKHSTGAGAVAQVRLLQSIVRMMGRASCRPVDVTILELAMTHLVLLIHSGKRALQKHSACHGLPCVVALLFSTCHPLSSRACEGCKFTCTTSSPGSCPIFEGKHSQHVECKAS